ncbi:MAG: ACT domain-containing protein [Dehalococcoidales bacterium]|nr:ACT domain-containing protein [Dehalococcoidales bacterium]
MTATTILKQVSVFVENRPGRLQAMLKALYDRQINIRALSVADTSDFGIVRMILSDTEGGLKALREAGLTASTTDVLRVEISDDPGALLNMAIDPLAEAALNVEYVYAFVDRPNEQAAAVIKVNDTERARRVLEA